MLKIKIMKKTFCILLSFICTIPIFGQTTGIMTDSRDGKTYKTIKIGDQEWMAENLNYDTVGGSWCYNDNPINCKKNGRLYNFETAIKVAPKGWHLPTKAEYQVLLKNIADSLNARYNNLTVGGSSGFNALLSGKRNGTGAFAKYKPDQKTYDELDLRAYFWYIFNTVGDVWALYVDKTSKKVSSSSYVSTCGFSVRCIKD